jgi:hypothetical protein
MGLFETPIVVGVVALLLVVAVTLRWRGRRIDEWRADPKPPEAAAPPTGGERSAERP